MLFFSTLFFSTFGMDQKEKIKKTVQFSAECTVKRYEIGTPYEMLFELENIKLSDKQSKLRNPKRPSRNLVSADRIESSCTKSSCLVGLGLSALYCIIKNCS